MTEATSDKAEASLIERLAPALAALAGAYASDRIAASRDVPDFGVLVAAAATLLVLVVGNRFRRSFVTELAALTFVVGLSVGSAYAISEAVEYRRTAPGRDARAEAAKWSVLVSDDFDNAERVEQAGGRYGTGYGIVGDGRLLLHGESEISHAVPWVFYPDVEQGRSFYAEVKATLLAGPEDTGCGLIFGWRDADNWWGIRVVHHGSVLISRYEGFRNERMDARTFYGPDEILFADVRKGVTIGVLATEGRFRFFMDDRLVTELSASQLLSPNGSVGPFAIDSATLYRAVYECEFRNLRVWVQD